MTQYLLEKIAYTSRKPQNFKSSITQTVLRIENTFPYNPDSKTAPKTARRWAKNYIENYTPKIIVQDNKPFKVCIVDLDVRSEGGRAYKVIDEAGRMFDLREDQFVEVLIHGGVEKGGQINGEFVWGQQFSSVRLVYVGGEQYNEMVKGLEERKNKKPKVKTKKTGITKSQLELGGVYTRKVFDCNEITLYLGAFYLKTNPKEVFHMLKNVTPRNRLVSNHGTKTFFKSTTWQDETFYSENNSLEAQKSFNPFFEKLGQHDQQTVENIRKQNIGAGLEKSFNFRNKLDELKGIFTKTNPHPKKVYGFTCTQKEWIEYGMLKEKWNIDFSKWLEEQIVWKN
jgi:hypothetical protein